MNKKLQYLQAQLADQSVILEMMQVKGHSNLERQEDLVDDILSDIAEIQERETLMSDKTYMWAMENDCLENEEVTTCDDCGCKTTERIALVWSDVLVICGRTHNP